MPPDVGGDERATGLELELTRAHVVERLFGEPAADPSSLEGRADLGVEDRHPPSVEAILRESRQIAIHAGFVAVQLRVVADLDAHTASMTILSSPCARAAPTTARVTTSSGAPSHVCRKCHASLRLCVACGPPGRLEPARAASVHKVVTRRQIPGTYATPRLRRSMRGVAPPDVVPRERRRVRVRSACSGIRRRRRGAAPGGDGRGRRRSAGRR